jgi:hypothetical protein
VKPLAWPNLLGIICAAIAIGLVLSQVDPFWWRYSVIHEPVAVLGWVTLFSGVSLLVLSRPLYRGRDWARRAVLVVGVLWMIGFLVLDVVRDILPRCAYSPPRTGWILLQDITHIIGHIGMLIAAFGPHIIFLALLCHPAVRASFRQTPQTI